jgi:aconitate hydratase
MGLSPLQFEPGESAQSLGLTGQETYYVTDIPAALGGGAKQAAVRAVSSDGAETNFTVAVRVDTPQEVEYYRKGGILPYVLRELANEGRRTVR